jgi:transposase
MDVVFTHGAGLDLHKQTGVACRVTPAPTGQQADGVMAVKALGTLTRDLLALCDWLAAAGITPVAMESPGESWRPVHNRVEGTVTLVLVNAAQVKPGPGRKTDKAEARWLAQLRPYGVLAASFSPPQGQRDWRDLTRYRTAWVQERSREVNRVQGVLARATMKRASVATGILGVSGRAILAALSAGQAEPGTMDAGSSSLLILWANCPALPGTADGVRPIPTEAHGCGARCEPWWKRSPRAWGPRASLSAGGRGRG